MSWLRRAWRGQRARRADDVVQLPTVDAETAQTLATYRQGDHLPKVGWIEVTQAPRGPLRISAPDGVVIVSQTCDVVQSNRSAVQVARLVHLEGSTAVEARDGRRPRYVHVPARGQTAFADLEVIGTMTKVSLAGQERTPGVDADGDVRRFGQAVGRKFNRFPFPDHVVDWLRPLEEIAQSKSQRPQSLSVKPSAEFVNSESNAMMGGMLNHTNSALQSS